MKKKKKNNDFFYLCFFFKSFFKSSWSPIAMWCLLLITYLSKKGIRGSTINPPRKIPKACSFNDGSINAAIKSAKACAIITPMIPAINPFEINFRNLLN